MGWNILSGTGVTAALNWVRVKLKSKTHLFRFSLSPVLLKYQYSSWPRYIWHWNIWNILESNTTSSVTVTAFYQELFTPSWSVTMMSLWFMMGGTFLIFLLAIKGVTSSKPLLIINATQGSSCNARVRIQHLCFASFLDQFPRSQNRLLFCGI